MTDFFIIGETHTISIVKNALQEGLLDQEGNFEGLDEFETRLNIDSLQFAVAKALNRDVKKGEK